jgi:osomolarity two-component system response regulator SKN7
VLVVEDNVMYRRISMRCLQRLGCDFDLACDGLEAVSCMKTSQYDLILMDISIPKLDGMAATRKLRQYDQHTPVVSMTANYSDHDIENYVGSGMSDLLPKPFDQHKLYDILKQHCAHLV